ncbi:MAG: carbohydrate porin [Prochloraceae cyanobacterium]
MLKYLTCNYSIIIAIAFLTEIAWSTKVTAQDKAINTTVTEVLEASTHASDLLFVPEQSATQLISLENFDTFNLAVLNSLEFWQDKPNYLEFLEFDATTAISFPETKIAQYTDGNEVVQATPESEEVTPDSPKEANRDNIKPPTVLSEPTEPSNQIVEIRQRSQERDALIPISPLGFVRKATDGATDAIYDAVKLDLGLSFSHAFQWLTDSLPDQDRWGTATDMDFIARWDILNADKPSRGSFLFHLEGRWEYETTGPQNLGFVSLGSAIGTANTFSAYDPTFLVRNFYWQQGGRETGWYYRIGKITPDAILATSKYLNPTTTFLPNAGTGFFSLPLPDSGLGVTGAVKINDRFAMIGVISDANGNRFNYGDIGKGQFFTAIEFAGKIAPKTEKAGYSKLTFTYHPGGKAINASTGEPGFGVSLKLEQELTSDGRLIGIARYATNTNDSAIYNQQAGLHLVLNEPRVFNRLKNDAVGLAFNWVQSTFSDGNEYDIEAFYRFPVIQLVDMTLHFQQVFNPSFAPNIDSASVFSIRLKTSF